MAKSIAEWIFKFLLLALAASWLFIYWQKRDDGRYVKALDADGRDLLVDSRTGTLYLSTGQTNYWVEIHPQTGQVTPRKMKSTDSN